MEAIIKPSYSPHFFFKFEKKQYLLKVVETPEEATQAFKLRRKVFGQMSHNITGDIDTDDYDQNADHLIVINKDLGQVVGTYRLLLSSHVRQHYSEREFNLKSFLTLPGEKLELGRASVDPEARAGAIISLLWRGIAEYIKLSKVDYLFGCSSFWNTELNDIICLARVFSTMNLISELEIQPLKSNHPPLWEEEYRSYPNMEMNECTDIFEHLIPTLVKTYLHIGAKFTIPPAYDHKLKTFEFFGFCKIDQMNPAFKKKYLSEY